MTARRPTLNRVRPRTVRPVAAAPADGKRALFSPTGSRPPLGGVAIDCSRCGQQSVLHVSQALRALMPSVHLPLPWRRYRSYLRCPACHRASWVAVRIRI